MAVEIIGIENFIENRNEYVTIDVRSPIEFDHAHIPESFHIPIFDNEERKIIGTSYKQQSRQQAIKIGLQFFGKKLLHYIETIEIIIQKNPMYKQKKILVYCWRGGMRSEAIAWLLDLYGYNVCKLKGGYKNYRNWALQQFILPYSFKVIGGYTGSYKTEILHDIKNKNFAVIDLEGIANHKGSAFGGLGQIKQPSQEMFENILAWQLFFNNLYIQNNHQTYIFIEDESQRIGNIILPIEFFKTIRNGKTIFLDIPFEIRLQHILQGYGHFNNTVLIEATERIKKRLGGLETKNVISYFQTNNFIPAFTILLKYYDKHYIQNKVNIQFPKKEIIYEKLNDFNMEQIIEIILKY